MAAQQASVEALGRQGRLVQGLSPVVACQAAEWYQVDLPTQAAHLPDKTCPVKVVHPVFQVPTHLEKHRGWGQTHQPCRVLRELEALPDLEGIKVIARLLRIGGAP